MRKKAGSQGAAKIGDSMVGLSDVAARLMEALANRRSSEPPESVQKCDRNGEVNRELIRTALAVVLKVPKSRITKAIMMKHIKQIEEDAHRDAELVGVYIDQMTLHLTRIDCIESTDIAKYLDAEEQVLSNLYAELERPHPSPTKLLQLSVQYALDARKSIGAPADRIDVRVRRTECEIAVHPSGVGKIPSLPYPGQVVGNPFANRLLSLVRKKPPAYAEVMELIESLVPRLTQERHEEGQRKPSASLLTVDLDDSLVVVAGCAYQVSNEGAHLVNVLSSEPNVWFGPNEYKQDAVLKLSRADRYYAKLPAPIKRLIESKPGAGFRLSTKRLAELSQKLSVAKPGRRGENPR